MALPDWQILARFGQAMGFSGFQFEDSGAVWDEFIGLTAGRPCDMAGMTSERLRRERHLRWPCPSVDHPGTERLYLDRKFPTPSGRARFHARRTGPQPRDHRPRVPAGADDRPAVCPLAHADPHGQVAQAGPARAVGVRRGPPRRRGRVGLAAGQWAELSSRRGLIRLPVKTNPGLSRGVVFVPFHWGDLQGENVAANYLTIPAIGRIAKQPEFKYCAVRLAPAPDAPEPAPDFARTTRRDKPQSRRRRSLATRLPVLGPRMRKTEPPGWTSGISAAPATCRRSFCAFLYFTISCMV